MLGKRGPLDDIFTEKELMDTIKSLKLIRQFLTRFSTYDWFLAMLKISTEHGSRVPGGSCFRNRKQH